MTHSHIQNATTGSAQLGNIAIFGMGSSGEAVVHYCASLPKTQVSSITCFLGDSPINEDVKSFLCEAGCEVVSSYDFDSALADTSNAASLEALGAPADSSNSASTDTSTHTSYDLGIISPGIAPHTPIFRYAQMVCKELIGEAEFAWRLSPEKWLVITGTNGKTTTTTLTKKMLVDAGIPAQEVGNIGTPATAQLSQRSPESWFVAELSSYQLATSEHLHPRVAALLNITDDHVRWHTSLEKYAAAKERVFMNMTADDLAIISQDDSWCLDIAQRAEERGLRVCYVSCKAQPEADEWAYCDNGVLKVQLKGSTYEICKATDLHIRGTHNIENALVSSVAALELGASLDCVRETLLSFSGLEHRIEDLGVVGTLRFVNDSKATNVDAARQALSAFKPKSIVMMLGGSDKMTDLTALAQEVCEKCCVAVCYGAARGRLLAALEEERTESGASIRLLNAEYFDDAFSFACSAAPPNSVILLSPACASFDEFSGFEERGNYFKQLVLDYRNQEAANAQKQQAEQGAPNAQQTEQGARGEQRGCE